MRDAATDGPGTIRPTPPIRPEYELIPEPIAGSSIERRVSLPQRLFQQAWLRKGLILIFLGVLWEIVARIQGNDLLLPSFTQTFGAFVEDIANGVLPDRAANSIDILVKGYVAGVILAFVLTSLAVSSQLGRDFLSTLTSMLNPLPPIALLPLGLLWFGLGEGSLVFVLIHSVLWPLALNMYTGFRDFPEMTGLSPRNLKYMRAFAEAFPSEEIVQQLVAHLPWGHNVKLIEMLKDSEERLWYARHAVDHGWSRNVLVHQIESGLIAGRERL